MEKSQGNGVKQICKYQIMLILQSITSSIGCSFAWMSMTTSCKQTQEEISECVMAHKECTHKLQGVW